MMEKEAADKLLADWDEVILKSKNVDASLRIVKRKFIRVHCSAVIVVKYCTIRAARIND